MWVKMHVVIMDWMDWVIKLLDGVGLHIAKWTHAELCLYLQKWTDYNLAWNVSEYGGIKSVRIPPMLLWKPDILMYNRSV